MSTFPRLLIVPSIALLVSCTSAGAVESTPSSTSTSTPTSTTSSTSTTSTSTTTTLPPKGELVIQGTGDVNLDPTYVTALAENGYDHAWQALDGLFTEDDLTVVNLECAPSDIGTPQPKKFVFRCPVESLPSLQRAGVEVANLGNNHSGDYGKEALVDGVSNLAAVWRRWEPVPTTSKPAALPFSRSTVGRSQCSGLAACTGAQTGSRPKIALG